jgi:hypothetical protein
MDYEKKTYQDIRERAGKLAAQGKLKYLHATDLANGSKDPALNWKALGVDAGPTSRPTSGNAFAWHPSLRIAPGRN